MLRIVRAGSKKLLKNCSKRHTLPRIILKICQTTSSKPRKVVKQNMNVTKSIKLSLIIEK
nr:MAG TPA: hypothetical protein [Caudoviricetes sp.]